MSGIVNKVKDALHGDHGDAHKHKNNNNVPEGTYGPHSSRVGNTVDPRVDSDLDNTGRTGRVAGHGEYGSGSNYNSNLGSGVPSSGTMGSGPMGTGHGATGTTGLAGANNAYESSSHAPAHHHQAGTGVTGVTGTHGAPAGTHGPHSSRVANVADPRVDSDRDGRAALGTGPGPAPNTAGPHNNDMMNKVDPRVDSDLDGSRTVGGNKTFQ
jgi:hypothetical protein